MASRFFARFGNLCVCYEGDLSLLEGTLLDRFADVEQAPAITISLRRAQLAQAPKAPCEFESINTRVWHLPDGTWHRRYSAVYAGERREYAAMNYCENRAELTIAPICQNTARAVEGCVAFEHLAICAGSLPIHASHIQTQFGSLVFTGPSGIGKSTQAALWEKTAKILNGDKTLLQLEQGEIFAASIPYCGTSDICHRGGGKLAAIVVLEQAKENHVQQLHAAQAVSQLMASVIRNPWHRDDAQRALELAAQIAQRVPIYKLRCVPNETAVHCLRTVLEKGGAEFG
ncbi:MAG: hypothetical protein LBM28_06265 [Oscillospiraceae bacterium]|jgi:hypothetical protein|nr:hypothetical protein [Oscillospiraceae bacterium]